ncbi:hypothetical protein OROHE_003880 [Orobanche hederae]
MSTSLASMRRQLYDQDLAQGYLEAEQFDQLEDLQDDETPNFAEDAVNSYYKNSTPKITEIAQALKNKPLDFEKLANLIDPIDSTSIGALKVVAGCADFKEYCEAENGNGCKTSFKQLKKDHSELKKKLAAYFKLAKKARSS